MLEFVSSSGGKSVKEEDKVFLILSDLEVDLLFFPELIETGMTSGSSSSVSSDILLVVSVFSTVCCSVSFFSSSSFSLKKHQINI